MTSVLVSLLCEGGGPLDLSSFFGAAAARAPPEEAAARLLLLPSSGPSSSPLLCLARTLAPRAARALAVVAPSCPRGEAAGALERIAAAARALHESYAALAADSDDENGKRSSGASWLSSPALSASGALRGAFDAAFMACVAALRALAVPAGALVLAAGSNDSSSNSNGNNGNGNVFPPEEPRAAAAALDALALISFARPPNAVIQAHSNLVASLLEAASAAIIEVGTRRQSVGAALVERIPRYEFFISPSSSTPNSLPRWISDSLLATRAHFYLLSLAPAARGMRKGGEAEEGETEAARAAAALALLFLGHPASPALCGAAHALAAALMDRGGPLSASAPAGRQGRGRAPPPPLLLPGFLDRALDSRGGGVRPHYPGLSIAVAAALRGCSCCEEDEIGEQARAQAAAASLLVPRRLSAALRESLLLSSRSSPPPSSSNSSSRPLLPPLSPDSLALVSALASTLLSVDARGVADACSSVERALSPNPTGTTLSSTKEAPPPPQQQHPSSSPSPSSSSSSSFLPPALSAAAFDALGRAIGSADDLLRKPALARWWAGAAARVGVAAGR